MSKRRKTLLRVVAILVIPAAVGAFIWFSPLSPYQHGRYIPRDLDAAHACLLKQLPAEELQLIRDMKTEEEMINYHFGLGTGLRNDWGLWGGSRLSRYFNGIGIQHPDDMSGIILDTFWCKLHGQPQRLSERVAKYQDYWKSESP